MRIDYFKMSSNWESLRNLWNHQSFSNWANEITTNVSFSWWPNCGNKILLTWMFFNLVNISYTILPINSHKVFFIKINKTHQVWESYLVDTPVTSWLFLKDPLGVGMLEQCTNSCGYDILARQVQTTKNDNTNFYQDTFLFY